MAEFQGIYVLWIVLGVVGIIALLWILWAIILKILASCKARDMRDRALRKRSQRDRSIEQPAQTPSCSKEMIEAILEASLSQLRDYLNEGKVTSEDLVLIFHERCRTKGLQLELVGDFNLQEALTIARDCDSKRRSTTDKSKLSPLFGIPISIKDCFDQKGMDSTCGMASQCFRPKQADGAMLRILRAEGAIPFVRSNLPQAVFTIESMNNVWGRAKNPWNLERTTGGSSGGEAGLISMRCSPIGLGTDVGGSLRTPPLFCGVIGFKPTSRRQNWNGATNFYTVNDKIDNFTVISTNGAIGKYVDDVAAVMQVIMGENTFADNPFIASIPFRVDLYKNPPARMNIGFITSDDWIPAGRANRRAVQEAVAAMQRRGHQVIDVTGKLRFDDIYISLIKLLTAEGGLRGTKRGLAGESLMDEYSLTDLLVSLPNWVQKLLPGILDCVGQARLARLSRNTGELMAWEYFEATSQLVELIEKFHGIWDSYQLDALISPGMATPAFRHGQSSNLVATTLYTGVFNAVDCPGGVVPITTVRPGEDVYDQTDSPVRDDITSALVLAIEGTVGLPIGVHVSAKPYQDERCLAVMKQIEAEFNFRPRPPISQ